VLKLDGILVGLMKRQYNVIEGREFVPKVAVVYLLCL